MTRRAAAIALLLAVLAAGSPACSRDRDDDRSSRSDVSTGISQARAIEIARDHVETEMPAFEFERAYTVAVDAGDHFDVSFPPRTPGSGGEPHVLVDKTSGKVTDLFHTL